MLTLCIISEKFEKKKREKREKYIRKKKKIGVRVTDESLWILWDELCV